MKFKAIYNKFLILIFFAIILISIVANTLKIDINPGINENRILSKKPNIPQKFADIKTYLRSFEKYYNDNFGLRKVFIKANSEIMDDIFDTSPFNATIIGKNGWLFQNTLESIIDFQGKKVLSKDELKTTAEYLVENWKELESNNIDYLFLALPNKTSIYSEYLPSNIKKGKTRLDQITEYLNKHYPDFPIIDLRPVFLSAKQKEQIYQITDSHWNHKGAFIAYTEFMNYLHKRYNYSKPLKKNNFIIQETTLNLGDLSKLINNTQTSQPFKIIPKIKINIKKNKKSEFLKYEPFWYKEVVPEEYISEYQHLPKLLILGDSFSSFFKELVPHHFSSSTLISGHYCKLNINAIKEQKVDLVIQASLERMLAKTVYKCLKFKNGEKVDDTLRDLPGLL